MRGWFQKLNWVINIFYKNTSTRTSKNFGKFSSAIYWKMDWFNCEENATETNDFIAIDFYGWKNLILTYLRRNKKIFEEKLIENHSKK